MAAILSSAFSLLRLAWAISAETVLRSAFSSSTFTNKSRCIRTDFDTVAEKLATRGVDAATLNQMKTIDKERRDLLVKVEELKEHFMKLLERQSRGSIQLHKSALA